MDVPQPIFGQHLVHDWSVSKVAKMAGSPDFAQKLFTVQGLWRSTRGGLAFVRGDVCTYQWMLADSTGLRLTDSEGEFICVGGDKWRASVGSFTCKHVRWSRRDDPSGQDLIWWVRVPQWAPDQGQAQADATRAAQAQLSGVPAVFPQVDDAVWRELRRPSESSFSVREETTREPPDHVVQAFQGAWEVSGLGRLDVSGAIGKYRMLGPDHRGYQLRQLANGTVCLGDTMWQVVADCKSVIFWGRSDAPEDIVIWMRLPCVPTEVPKPSAPAVPNARGPREPRRVAPKPSGPKQARRKDAPTVPVIDGKRKCRSIYRTV